MNTDKNMLFRAMGEIDDRYVTEILNEDRIGVKKNKKTKVTYMKYYVPAAAALLIAVIAVGSRALLSNKMSGTAPMSDSAAYAPTADTSATGSTSADKNDSYEAAACEEATLETDGAQLYTNGAEAAAECEEAVSSVQQGDDMTDNDGMDNRDPSATIANPFIECATLAEAEGIAGFEFTVSDEVGAGYDRYINAIKDTMIQIIFYDGEDEAFRIRKGVIDDISGDYNEYKYCTEIKLNGITGFMEGNTEGIVQKAEWTDGACNYSLTTEGAQLTEREVLQIIQQCAK